MLTNSDDNNEKSKKSQAGGNNNCEGAISDDTSRTGPIIPDKDPSELRQDPYNMPKGFEWSEVDIADPSQRAEVYDLLYQNYVEDDGCMFRFDYSPEFLIWALTPPGYVKGFHLGVRSSKSHRLMAFITGVPATVRVHRSTKEMVEVNYLCVHKRLRSKRLAPVLIKEITRRVNHTGVFQAVYTAGVVLPGHVASCRYYHRTLDAKKLVEIGFTRLHPRMTMARMQKLYKVPTTTSLTTLRPMTPADVPAAHALVVKYLEKFKLSVVFSEEEFAHWLLPREGVVSSFVNVTKKEGEGNGEEITDFCSYYHLHSSVLGNPKHTKLHAAYSFYNVANTVDLTDLMRDCLILAKNEGHDVFNALNLMENENFLADLKFGMGDGNLQYYVYNWLCPTMEHGDVGLVLL
jgi:glycylpeptide N-tetradecanoyltransferase